MSDRAPARLALILLLIVAVPVCSARRPATAGEVLELAGKVSRDVGAQYVVTYVPLWPFPQEGEAADVRAPHGAATLYAAGRRRRAAESNAS